MSEYSAAFEAGCQSVGYTLLFIAPWALVIGIFWLVIKVVMK